MGTPPIENLWDFYRVRVSIGSSRAPYKGAKAGEDLYRVPKKEQRLEAFYRVSGGV